MRYIKFRGKRFDNDNWSIGDLVHDDIGYVYVFPIDAEILNTKYRVDITTVGQYTGYTDKNGSEIYEGDIVVDENRQTAYVAWLPQECGFVLVYEKYDSWLGHRHRGSGYSFDENLEIIGNIHDNPGLVAWWNKQNEKKKNNEWRKQTNFDIVL